MRASTDCKSEGVGLLWFLYPFETQELGFWSSQGSFTGVIMTPRSGCGIEVMNTEDYMVEAESYINCT